MMTRQNETWWFWCLGSDSGWYRLANSAVCCHHLIGTWAREHSRLRVETGLRSVSSRQGSRNIRDSREHINLGRAAPDRLSDSRLVETTRYSVQVISSSMTCSAQENRRRRSIYSMIKLKYQPFPQTAGTTLFYWFHAEDVPVKKNPDFHWFARSLPFL